MEDKKKDKKKEEVILNESEESQSISNEEILNQVQDDERNETEKQQSEDLSQQLEEADHRYKRALADYQNLVRRTQDEKREWARLSNKSLVLKLLPILDTLMLAEKHTKDQNFTLTVAQFLQVLKEEGITQIKTVGEDFNPHTMEAVTTANGAEGKVVEEVRAGYTFGDTVLRPAQVIVGK